MEGLIMAPAQVYGGEVRRWGGGEVGETKNEAEIFYGSDGGD